MPSGLLGRKRMGKRKQNTPWWLEQGTEICPACSQAYVFQTEYRCVACDGQVCSDCVHLTTLLEVFCPDCAEPVLEGKR